MELDRETLAMKGWAVQMVATDFNQGLFPCSTGRFGFRYFIYQAEVVAWPSGACSAVARNNNHVQKS